MKKLALGMAAIMTASLVAIPLAACGNDSTGLNLKIDLTDYAVSLEEVLEHSTANKEAFTHADTYTGTVSAVFYSGSTLIKVTNNNESSDNKITVYDAATNTKIGDSYSSVSTTSTFATGTTTGTEADTYDVIADNGQVLVSDAVEQPTISYSTVDKYVGDPAVRKEFTTITYKAAATDETDTVIYVAEEDEAYVKYTEDEVKDSVLDTSVGTTLDQIGAQVASAREFYDNADEDKKTALDDYTYSKQETVAGRTQYTFYKNGKQCGTLTLEANESELITIGTSFFYQKRTIVDAYATKGFNAVYTITGGSSSSSMKAMIEYYRYDIAKNSVSSVKSDYIFDDANLLYNNKAESYDLAVATAVKKEDGVAYINTGYSGQNNNVSVVVHANGSMEDASNALYNINTVVELKDDRYCVVGEDAVYILNGKMEIVASLPGSAQPTSQGFVFTNEGRTGLADFDGKVIMTTKYTSLDFYGDKALTTVYTDDTPSAEPYIVSTSSPDGTAISSVVSYDETAGEDLLTNYKGLLVKTTDTVTEVYNYDGVRLGDTLNTTISTLQTICNRYYTVSVNGTTYLYR